MCRSVNEVDRHRINLAMKLTLVATIILCAFAAMKYEFLKLRVSFAAEQLSIFDSALLSANKTRSPRELSAELEYVINYYPSGSKQIRGSDLDRIVEIARSNARREIINRLRTVTGRDLGDEPDPWCKEYPPQRGQTIFPPTAGNQ